MWWRRLQPIDLLLLGLLQTLWGGPLVRDGPPGRLRCLSQAAGPSTEERDEGVPRRSGDLSHSNFAESHLATNYVAAGKSASATAVFCELLLVMSLCVVAASAQNAPATIVIDYPADGSLFPPDIAAPTFLWRDPAPAAVTWQVDISFADGSPAIHVSASGERMLIGEIDSRCISPTNQPPKLTPQQAAAHTWTPDPATWAAMKKQSAASAATVAVSGFASGNTRQPVSRGHLHAAILRPIPSARPSFTATCR